jgi:polysaccharide chain length determinant protein (PEP-CTERM system associated)
MLGHRVLNVEDYFTILKRRWWILAIPMVIFPVISIGATFFIPPQYKSETLVLIEQQKVPDEFVRSVVSQNLDSRIASMKEQIESRSQLLPIIDKYNLYADQHQTVEGRLDLARKNIDIQPIHSEISGSGGLPGFKIFFTASDPHTAQQVCAEITSLFTKENAIQRQTAAEGTTDFLSEQLKEARQTLDDQDAKLAAFKRQNFGMQPEDEAGNVTILNTLNSRLDTANQSIEGLQQAKSMIEGNLLQQPEATSSPVAGAPPPQVQEKELEQLEAQKADLLIKYKPEHPDVKAVERKIADLRSQMSQAPPAPSPSTPASVARPPVESAAVQKARSDLRGIALLLQSKQKEVEQLTEQIRTYQSRIQSTPEVEEQFKQLDRDAQTSLNFYNGLLAQSNQAREATALENRQEGESFRLLDEANLPEAPIWPKQGVFAMGGIAMGLAFGMLIVALLEYRDTALRTERDIWAFTQLPTLAVIVWSGDVANIKASRRDRLKRLFSRKPPKELAADARG